MIERIGSGGYGEVWLCRNVMGALRAVKIVRRAEFDDERPYEREFNGIRKFEPISRTHEGFVNILQVGRNEEEGYFYYVMELADPIAVADEVTRLTLSSGGNTNAGKSEPPHVGCYKPKTLASEVKTRGALPLPEVLQIAQTLARALAELHRHGLVHRDIKPSNIIVVNSAPKLADIGLVASATDSRSFVGTEGYIPPEGPGTPQADLYSLGIVLYVLATGKHHRDFPEPPADLATRPDRAQLLELTAIIHKATQTNPRDRYQTAEALLADVQRHTAGKSVKRRYSLHKAYRLSLIGAVGLTLAFAIGLFVKNQREHRAAVARANLPPWIKSGTTNPAAWQAWQRASQMGNTYTTAGLSNAIYEWQRATELDPNYVEAWSVLGVTLAIAVIEGHLPGTNVLPRAKLCAERAIAIDPAHGASYASLALCNLGLDYNFSAAEPLFRKAIQLDPAAVNLRNNFAWELLYQRRFAEAGELWKRLIAEQPQYANAHIGLAIIAYHSGLQKEALSLFDEGVRLAPDRPLWRRLRGDFLWALNQRLAAAQDLLDEVELGGFHFLDRKNDGADLRQLFKTHGPEAVLERLILLCEERQTTGAFVSGFDLARLYAHSGNVPKALQHLEIAIEERRSMIRSINVNPAFDVLRAEPRFQAALRRVHCVD
ncbi:MAG: serine/threonine protein kinase with repeat [Verrucomicrobiales bacterium]|nr:serine/threonine protein kinase with repeat [Verrucomicrobiales bacterium]